MPPPESGCSLKTLEAIYLKVVEASPDAKVVVDVHGKVVVFNSKAELLFGYDRDEVIGHPVELLLPDAFHKVHKRHFQHYMDNPETREMGQGRILKGKHSSGQEFTVQIKLAPMVVKGAGVFALAVVRKVKLPDETPPEDTPSEVTSDGRPVQSH